MAEVAVRIPNAIALQEEVSEVERKTLSGGACSTATASPLELPSVDTASPSARDIFSASARQKTRQREHASTSSIRAMWKKLATDDLPQVSSSPQSAQLFSEVRHF